MADNYGDDGGHQAQTIVSSGGKLRWIRRGASVVRSYSFAPIFVVLFLLIGGGFWLFFGFGAGGLPATTATEQNAEGTDVDEPINPPGTDIIPSDLDIVTPGEKPREVIYCQGKDAPWANQKYSVSTMRQTGCSPTSMAMILSSYGVTKTPGEIAIIFQQKGWDWPPGNLSCENSDGTARQCRGTRFSLTTDPSWLESMGFEKAQVDIARKTSAINLATVKKITDAGWLLYAAVNWPEIGGGGHQIVIQGADPASGKIFLRDPNDCKRGIITRGVSDLYWHSVVPIRVKQNVSSAGIQTAQ